MSCLFRILDRDLLAMHNIESNNDIGHPALGFLAVTKQLHTKEESSVRRATAVAKSFLSFRPHYLFMEHQDTHTAGSLQHFTFGSRDAVSQQQLL